MQQLEQRYQTAKQALFERAYDTLNPRQQEAVFQINDPLLILAGAGSGKTTVLVKRIAFMIRYGNAYFGNRIPRELTEERVRALEQASALPTERTLLALVGDPMIKAPTGLVDANSI